MGSGCLLFGLACLGLAFAVGGGGNGGVIDETTLKGILFVGAAVSMMMGLSFLFAPSGESGPAQGHESAPWP